MTGKTRRLQWLPAVVMLAAFRAALADTHFVAPDGNPSAAGTIDDPLASIQAAADRANPGDVIQIRGGTYGQRVSVTRSGSDGHPITFRNYADETVILDGTTVSGLGSTDALFAIDDASHIRLQGLVIRNSPRNGVRVILGTHVEIDGVEVHDCGENGIAFYNNAQPSYSSVRGSRVHHVQNAGIFLWHNHGGHFLIEHNEVHDVTGQGNHDGIQGNDTPWVICRQNTVQAMGAAGDYIDFGGDQNAAQTRNHHIVVDGNRLFPGGGSSAGKLKLNNRPYRAIYRGNVISYLGIAFYEQPFSEVAVYNNTIVNSIGHAIIFWTLDAPGGFGGIRVKNNVIAYSSDRLLMHTPNQVDGGPSSILMSGNVYGFGPGDGIEWAMDGVNLDFGTTAADFAAWRAATGQEPEGGTFVDAGVGALFVNPTGGNYGIGEDSPIVDAGVHLTRTAAEGSGTSLPVEESFYFHDGYGMTTGDLIRFGDQVRTVVDVDEANDRLILDEAATWTAGQGVSLHYDGDGPDAGAFEGAPGVPTRPENLERVDAIP